MSNEVRKLYPSETAYGTPKREESLDVLLSVAMAKDTLLMERLQQKLKAGEELRKAEEEFALADVERHATWERFKDALNDHLRYTEQKAEGGILTD